MSDDEDGTGGGKGSQNILDEFLRLKAAAVAEGKVPKMFQDATTDTNKEPPPRLVDRPFLVQDQAFFADSLDSPWSAATLPDSQVLVAERSGRMLVLGADGSQVRVLNSMLQLDDVSGIAATGTTAFICDMGQHCVHKVALSDGAPLGVIQGVEPPSTDNPNATWTDRLVDQKEPPLTALRYPRGCRVAQVDGQFCLFVSDSGNRRIIVYDAETLEPLRSIGFTHNQPVWDAHDARPKAFSMSDGGITMPMGLCTFDDVLCVVDSHEHRLALYTIADGTFIANVGGEGSEPGRFRSPFDVLACRDRLLVTEGGRLQVMDPAGTPNQVLDFGSSASLIGLTSDDTRIYVCDATSGAVHSLSILEHE
eukprot:CAMPEP_0115831040 /NCGR_PEP_ID=MMETSP0287-20121206/1933_1 /TAXON_ID=412157 /ORGANISM="Chrysochromulina rotalis, Strain UIO044" /LENGTH=364 /DNA_ID=CAMNT_0003284373 /DNA_START=18 /DNA_END=1112 /DNA_ORIENTATION=+